MSDQWIRKIGLVVTAGDKGLDLSELHIRFKTQSMNESAPNTAWIRIYNLSTNTALKIQKEYQEVSLQAGYENGNYAIIFKGQIMQVKVGRENNVDSYVDIIAADALLAYTFGFVTKALDSASVGDRLNSIATALKEKGVTLAPDAAATVGKSKFGGVLPRGKVQWGLAAPLLNDLAESTQTTWNIQNGVLTFTERSGYRPGEAVKLNSETGMVGVPEATEQGIEIKTLLNPMIGIGGRVQIDNADINQTSVTRLGYWSAPPMYANVTNDGIYRVLVAEHSGDTRGQEWYTQIVCLSLDGSN